LGFFIFTAYSKPALKTHIQKFTLLLFFILVSAVSYADVLDSLLKVIKKEDADTSKVKTLIDIGWEYSYSNIANTDKYANEALSLSEKLNYKEGLAQSYELLGVSDRNKAAYESAIENFKKSLQIRIELGQTEKQGKVYVNIANVYLDMSDYAKAERYYKMAIERAEQTHSVKTQITALTNLSVVYQNLGDYGKSLDCLFRSLKLNKTEKDPTQDGFIYANIGIIYEEQKQYKLAEEYSLRSLELFKELGRDDIQANVYNNLGIVYKNEGKYELALKNYNESMRLYKKIGMDFSATMLLSNIGSVYAEMKDYEKAFQCHSVALSEALKNNDNYYIAGCYMSLAELSLQTGKLQQAQTYAEKGLSYQKFLNDKNELKNDYMTLANIYSASGDHQKAFQNQKLALELSDSLNNDALNKRLGQMQAMYEADKKQAEIDLLQKDNEIKGERIIRQRVVNYAVVTGLLLMLFLAFVSFKRYREKKKANVEITLQKELIEEKNKSILDSIHYAKRIQRALLASDTLLRKNLPEYFVLYKPKDIVSGDFYWAHKTDSQFIMATSDCTGHGVPGAFMSLLNISKLNETVNERKIERPDLVLNNVREEIIKALNTDGSEEQSKDGMDAVLCSFDFQKHSLEFAAANNPVIIVRNNQLIEFKPDKFPVGIHQGELKPFTLQSTNLLKGDTVYTFTDGFADQFGGDKGKKLMTKNLKSLLLQISSKSLDAQKHELDRYFNEWKGNHEQVDDVLVIGVRV
jgi:tetratricopeptide (TPR) repeat protein